MNFSTSLVSTIIAKGGDFSRRGRETRDKTTRVRMAPVISMGRIFLFGPSSARATVFYINEAKEKIFEVRYIRCRFQERDQISDTLLDDKFIN